MSFLLSLVFVTHGNIAFDVYVFVHHVCCMFWSIRLCFLSRVMTWVSPSYLFTLMFDVSLFTVFTSGFCCPETASECSCYQSYGLKMYWFFLGVCWQIWWEIHYVFFGKEAPLLFLTYDMTVLLEVNVRSSSAQREREREREREMTIFNYRTSQPGWL